MTTALTPQATPSKFLPPIDAKARVSQFMRQLQDEICQVLQQLDGVGTFQEDAWERVEGGGGRSRVIRDGAVHLNYRYFEAGPVWWFGGGADLTPYYPFASDAAHFHSTLKQACDAHHPEYYSVFKPWCDEYFYLKHRREMRGVGGIFFDYQDGQEQLYRGPHPEGAAAVYSNQVGTLAPRSWEELFAFVRDCGEAFLPAYVPIVERRRSIEYGDRERNFQLYRRGRYVEFNLVYDRGTIFGLQTNGRTESILMSLPPLVRWEYGYQPEPNTKEAELYETSLKPQDWVSWTSLVK